VERVFENERSGGMRTWQIIGLMAVMILLPGSGCSSIHSDAVRELIKREGVKIDAAQRNIDLFQGQTAQRIEFMQKGLKDINERLKEMHKSEAKHQLVFSSYQNVTSKKGIDAYAVAYLIGKIYLADHEGLEKKVMDQFGEDFGALQEAAQRLSQSWKSLASLQHQIKNYANKSALASVDPEFIAAIVEQVPAGSESIKTVLEHSRTVNDALDEAATFSFLTGPTLQRGRSLTGDLIELLERIKKD